MPDRDPHYARFERPVLCHWQAESAPSTPSPFDTLCTHALACKRLPDLPRCGLRALAGYSGMRLPTAKRCAPHVVATALIWKNLVERLAKMGIDDMAARRRWMQSTPQTLLSAAGLPHSDPSATPGARPAGRISLSSRQRDLLYVGKAKSLKQRIGSCFQQRRHSEHILEMMTQAVDLDYVATATALEAALKEADDVQHMQPEYNIHLQAGGRARVLLEGFPVLGGVCRH